VAAETFLKKLLKQRASKISDPILNGYMRERERERGRRKCLAQT
jgi:hypothetical protein